MCQSGECEWCVLQPAASEGSEHTSLSLVTRGENGRGEEGLLSTQHISTHQLHCTCTTGTVVSTHAYCWHSAHTKETTVSQFTFSHICVHSVLKCAKAYKSAKAWTAHVKGPKVAPFFPLGKSLSSPVFGRKVQNPFL